MLCSHERTKIQHPTTYWPAAAGGKILQVLVIKKSNTRAGVIASGSKCQILSITETHRLSNALANSSPPLPDIFNNRKMTDVRCCYLRPVEPDIIASVLHIHHLR